MSSKILEFLNFESGDSEQNLCDKKGGKIMNITLRYSQHFENFVNSFQNSKVFINNLEVIEETLLSSFEESFEKKDSVMTQHKSSEAGTA